MSSLFRKLTELKWTLWVSETSCSGDSHDYRIAHFSDEAWAKEILSQAKKYENLYTHFYLEQYLSDDIPINPPSFDSI